MRRHLDPGPAPIEDRGPRAPGGRYGTRIHERDWCSDDRTRLERLLATLAGREVADAHRR